MGQTWETLLFAHWSLAPASLETVVPPQLPLDRYDGRAWIAVTPFRVRSLRLRGTVPVPRLSRFPELNVRTYVTIGGKPGIYFLSLDAGSRLAVATARRSYRLPYFAADASIDCGPGGVSYRSNRIASDGPPARFDATYTPIGEARPPPSGSLEEWLTERYCLYTLDERQQIWRGELHHPPWPLQKAEAQIEQNTMVDPYGLRLEGEPLLHFASRQDVALWPIKPA